MALVTRAPTVQARIGDGIGTRFSLAAVALLTLLATSACSSDETERRPSVAATGGTAGAGGGATGGAGGGATGGAGGGAGSSGSAGSGAQPVQLAYRDINHVLSTGQSLSVGVGGPPALSVTQPYDNVMFAGGIAAVFNLTSFAPLVEGVNPLAETMSSGFANYVTQMAHDEVLLYQPMGERTHNILVTLHGVSSAPYLSLKKGTPAYNYGMAQIAAASTLTAAQSLSHVIRAVTTVHGESDHLSGNTKYEADLVQWQADYEADAQAVTKQSEPVVLLQTQMSSWTKYATARSLIPSAQLAASENNPNKIVLVGPKYNLVYVDGVHLTNEGYRHMGAYYAKVYRHVVLEGKSWRPLAPTAIARNQATITVDFDVPVPPLVLDTTLVTDPGNYGFEYADDSGAAAPPIASVKLAGPESVTVTLAAAPTGTNPRLRYAFTGVPGAAAGASTGPRGNLRDSDASSSPNGRPLHNWCVPFDKTVP